MQPSSTNRGNIFYPGAKLYASTGNTHPENQNEALISPWYRLNPSALLLNTPEWTFKTGDRMRFEDSAEK